MSLTSEEIDSLVFDAVTGLLPAVIQDVDTGDVLMVAHMNRAAVRLTLERRRAVFFSRSRQRLWEKGETSGNVLTLVALHADCDRDTLLVTVRPTGPACHTGARTCFGNEPVAAQNPHAFLSKLQGVIERRAAERPDGSYTANLFAAGARRIAQKVGEEGLEVALAAVSDSDEQIVSESADLLYHLLVLLKSRGLTLDSVVNELEKRHSG